MAQRSARDHNLRLTTFQIDHAVIVVVGNAHQERLHVAVCRLWRTSSRMAVYHLHFRPDWLGILLPSELSPKLVVMLEHAFRVGSYDSREAKRIERGVEREFGRFYAVPLRLYPLSGIACGFEVFNR
jgi:hypothetical protein